MLKKVETVRTSFSKLDFVEALIKAWHSDYQTLPLKSQIAIIFAQWSIETGQGTFCWNNNIGNSKAVDVPGQVIEYCALNGVWEIVNGKKVILKPEDPGAWFRAFPTLDTGVRHHFDLLRNKRYKIAWAEIEAGNPAGFSKKLKQQGYYTAPEKDYTLAVTAYSRAFASSSLFEQAVANISQATYTEPVRELIEPENIPVLHPFIEFEQHNPEFEDSPIQLNWVGQLYNFIMMLLELFIKKK